MTKARNLRKLLEEVVEVADHAEKHGNLEGAIKEAEGTLRRIRADIERASEELVTARDELAEAKAETKRQTEVGQAAEQEFKDRVAAAKAEFKRDTAKAKQKADAAAKTALADLQSVMNDRYAAIEALDTEIEEKKALLAQTEQQVQALIEKNLGSRDTKAG